MTLRSVLCTAKSGAKKNSINNGDGRHNLLEKISSFKFGGVLSILDHGLRMLVTDVVESLTISNLG